MLPRKPRKPPLTRPKTARELKAMVKAIMIVKKTLEGLESPFGRTERDVAREIRRRIYSQGAKLSFRPIVATGGNTCYVHHRPGERTIRRENPLIIDLGARFGGQCSDITRTYIPAGNRGMKRIYMDALDMQRRIIKMIRPGTDLKELNEFYRKGLEKKGYKARHSIGHGLGPHIHERAGELKPGMVITVEPGIYIKNLGGCRIEDMALIKGRGAVILSDSIPRGLYGRV